MPNNPIGNAPTILISDNSANPGQSATYSDMQTSFQARSEGFLKAALKEGVLRQDTPKLHEFSGKHDDGKASWRRWELKSEVEIHCCIISRCNDEKFEWNFSIISIIIIELLK